MRRSLTLGMVALIVLVLVAFMATLYWVTSGSYCRLTVISIVVQQDAQVTLTYKSESSNRTKLVTRHLVDGASRQVIEGGGGWEFPAMRVRGGATEVFSLDPERRDRESTLDLGTLRKRMLLVEGETYEVIPDKPLILYRFTSESGRIYEGQLEVR